ncbi:MAG TPA: glycoside hydrolase family 9 protein [Streptosporangiaceae bacterium]|nr:glycoside hydrolase family 9 protein [Streptosporangiaceae bacterium]
MDPRRGRQGRTWLGRTRRGVARPGALVLAAALCGAAVPATALGGAASASTGSGGGTPGGSAVAKICAEPSSGAVLTTGSHRKPAGAPAAAIRVDQVGYPSGAAKLAEIMTKAKPASDLPGGGLRWVLVRAGSCTVAASGVARQNLGAWSKRYGWVWAARFSRVRAPGRYRVGILGDASAASPWFTIGSAARLYARPLANALYFYENERDGPDFIHTALRSAPGHLNDASAMTYRTPPVDGNGNFKGSLAKYATGVRINATGGWFDAGDYLHFVETTSYTEAVLLQGVASFPRQMGSRSGTDFTGEVKFGLDFLQRMWRERSRTLYYQVGTGEANSYYFADHDIWRLPQADDHYRGTNPHYVYIRHPPVFRAGRPGAKLSPNLAGRLAADFALCYQVLRHSDPGYAGGCLRSAETVYSLADPHWKGHLMTAIPWDFYPETSWRDDMMLGATELARALQEAGHPAALPAGLAVRSATTYLRDAARWASAWIHSKQALADTLNLYDVSALADYELVLAIRGQHATGLAVTTAQLLADLRGQIEKGIHIGAKDPFRFGFAWDQWDTTTHGAGLTVMADEYDALVGRPVYAAWAQRWLDDILGSNAWGVSLIVGDGTVFPDCMQHQVANLAGSLDGQPPVLAGAAVEGPNSFAATGTVPNMRRCAASAPRDVPYAAFNGQKAVFADNVQSYSTVEPAIDLTALTPLAFAWQQNGAR